MFVLAANRDPHDLSHEHLVPALECCWRPIVQLAQQLSRLGQVGDADVRLALGLSKLPEVASFQIASIRSGACPPGAV